MSTPQNARVAIATQNSASNKLGGYHRFNTPSTAASTAGPPAGETPINRSTMAPAVSTAILRTLAMAACLVEAMVRSASVSLPWRSLSIALRDCSGLGVELVAGLIGDGLRAGARVGQCLFVGRDRRVGLALERARLGHIVGDTLRLVLENRPPCGSAHFAIRM